MSVVQLEAQALPWQLLNKQLFCHSAVTRPHSPLRQGARMATELPASEPASPHSSKWGQEQMPHSWVLPAQPGARHCADQQLCGSEDVVKVTKSTKNR